MDSGGFKALCIGLRVKRHAASQGRQYEQNRTMTEAAHRVSVRLTSTQRDRQAAALSEQKKKPGESQALSSLTH